LNNNRNMRAFIYILLALGLAGGSWYLGTQSGVFTPSDTSNQSAQSQSQPRLASNAKTLRCQGKLEPASGLIKIVAPVGSRIEKLTDAQVGSEVVKDQVLATLQSRDLRAKDLALAIARRADAIKKVEFEKEQGGFKLASAKLTLEEAQSSQERIAAEAKKSKLLVRQFNASKRLLDRLQRISSNPATNDLVNQTDLEKQELLVEQLRLQIDQANLELDLAKKAAQRAIALAENNVVTMEFSLKNAEQAVPKESLDAAIEMARLALEMTEIKSPIDRATVLDVIVREGDSVTNQPIMVLGDTSQMHCVAEIDDQFLRLIDLQQYDNLRAKITSPAFPAALLGTVVSKGVMIGAPSLKDPNPFASVDRSTGNLTIRLDDAQAAAGLVNLQVDVEIEVEPGAIGHKPVP
jgi:HlyD family secretion protein